MTFSQHFSYSAIGFNNKMNRTLTSDSFRMLLKLTRISICEIGPIIRGSRIRNNEIFIELDPYFEIATHIAALGELIHMIKRFLRSICKLCQADIIYDEIMTEKTGIVCKNYFSGWLIELDLVKEFKAFVKSDYKVQICGYPLQSIFMVGILNRDENVKEWQESMAKAGSRIITLRRTTQKESYLSHDGGFLAGFGTISNRAVFSSTGKQCDLEYSLNFYKRIHCTQADNNENLQNLGITTRESAMNEPVFGATRIIFNNLRNFNETVPITARYQLNTNHKGGRLMYKTTRKIDNFLCFL